MICDDCAHRCQLTEGQTGRCGTHIIEDGKLHLRTYGIVAAGALEPIEHKPLLHFHPGSKVYTVGLPGCILQCRFCTNYEISQHAERMQFAASARHSPEKLANLAIDSGAQGLAFSYTDPLSALGFVIECMQAAHAHGLFNIWHTSAYFTESSLRRSALYLDAACIDLKHHDDRRHLQLTGGHLFPVLESITRLRQAGVWVEISTPILTGVNDNENDIRYLSRLILRHGGEEVPWHLIRGVPAYRMSGLSHIVSTAWLERACAIAKEEGLHRVHIYLNPRETI